ncbi:MAG: hypothetical protein GX285_09980 [Clostridiales bacterium]|nr:hypothetical protein [Clostridiales bacterium]
MKGFKKKERAILFGVLLIFAGLLIRSSVFDADINIGGTAFALLTLSIGVGFTFAGIFSKDIISISDVKKYMMVPLVIAAIIMLFKKYEMDMPVLQVAVLFGVNILFFKKEIKKALKSNE